MQRTMVTVIGTGVAALGLTFGTFAIANADDPTSGSDSAAEESFNGHRHRGGETLLTGEGAERATVAAREAVPGGTVMRVETDVDGPGTYEAHVRNEDGTVSVVHLDDAFAVISVEEFAGRGGPGGPRPGPRDWAPATDEQTEQATAAALEAVPGGSVLRVAAKDDGTFEAHVRKDDGTMVHVELDAGFAVVSVDECDGPRAPRRGQGLGPDGDRAREGHRGPGGFRGPGMDSESSVEP